MTELQLHARCVMWFINRYPDERLMWHHNDNNSYNALEGNKKKALGVKKGWWDLEWITPDGELCFIEFKVGTNTLTDKQKEFRERILKRFPTAFFFVERTFESFIYLVKTKLDGKIMATGR